MCFVYVIPLYKQGITTVNKDYCAFSQKRVRNILVDEPADRCTSIHISTLGPIVLCRPLTSLILEYHHSRPSTFLLLRRCLLHCVSDVCRQSLVSKTSTFRGKSPRISLRIHEDLAIAKRRVSAPIRRIYFSAANSAREMRKTNGNYTLKLRLFHFLFPHSAKVNSCSFARETASYRMLDVEIEFRVVSVKNPTKRPLGKRNP